MHTQRVFQGSGCSVCNVCWTLHHRFPPPPRCALCGGRGCSPRPPRQCLGSSRLGHSRCHDSVALPRHVSVSDCPGGPQEREREEPFASVTDPAERKQLVAELHKLKTDIFMDMVEAGSMPLRPGVARLVGACPCPNPGPLITPYPTLKPINTLNATQINPEADILMAMPAVGSLPLRPGVGRLVGAHYRPCTVCQIPSRRFLWPTCLLFCTSRPY